MDNNQLNIVCYMGGACGDLITAMLDYTLDVKLVGNRVALADERSRLKKPHLFKNDTDKDLYLESIAKKYKSISSHDLNYHLRQRHKFISIVITDLDSALFAAQRFKNLHRAEVWQQMHQVSGADTVEKYAQQMLDYSSMIIENSYSKILIDLKKILAGQAVEELQKYNFTVDSQVKIFYSNWLNTHTSTL